MGKYKGNVKTMHLRGEGLRRDGDPEDGDF